MPTWDRRTPLQQVKVRDAALRRQLRDAVGPFSPFWRDRFAALRLKAAEIDSASQLFRLPAVGERDVCPSGDPAEAARLVLQADEAGFALHAYGPDLRKAFVYRLLGNARYRRAVEAETRPVAYHFAGRALRFPVASTRRDLDVIARAGARAWNVLGLTRADVLVSAVPTDASLDHTFLTYAAIGAGAPALFPGTDRDAVAETLRMVDATVVAVRPEDAIDVLDGLDLAGITTIVLVGAADTETREAVEDIAHGTPVLGLWGPAEGRVLWAQCRESAAVPTGWHTYPDIDYVELVDPETGKPADNGGEITVTQLGLRGSALLRWRTGDLVDAAIAVEQCPACRRTVPRVPAAVTESPLHVKVGLRHGEQHVDLRSVAGALEGRTDLAAWVVEVVPSPREHETDLLVLIAATGDETDVAMGVYRDVRAAAGVSPSQVVVLTEAEIAARTETGGQRVVVR